MSVAGGVTLLPLLSCCYAAQHSTTARAFVQLSSTTRFSLCQHSVFFLRMLCAITAEVLIYGANAVSPSPSHNVTLSACD